MARLVSRKLLIPGRTTKAGGVQLPILRLLERRRLGYDGQIVQQLKKMGGNQLLLTTPIKLCGNRRRISQRRGIHGDLVGLEDVKRWKFARSTGTLV